jgi:hypothetical protein
MKRDTARRHDDIGRRRCDTGDENGEDDASWADTNLTGPKNKENTCGRFSLYKWTMKI